PCCIQVGSGVTVFPPSRRDQHPVSGGSYAGSQTNGDGRWGNVIVGDDLRGGVPNLRFLLAVCPRSVGDRLCMADAGDQQHQAQDECSDSVHNKLLACGPPPESVTWSETGSLKGR